MGWPVLSLLLAYAAGVLAGVTDGLSTRWLAALVIGAGAMALGDLASRVSPGARVGRRRGRWSGWRGTGAPWAWVGLLIPAAAAVGGLRGVLATADAMSPPLREVGRTAIAAFEPLVVAEGRLRGDAELTDFGVGFALDVSHVIWRGRHVDARGGLRVSIPGEIGRAQAGEWRDGRTVRMPATLRAPQPYRNPGVPDQTWALARRGLTWLASVKSGALVEVTAPGNRVEEWASALRGRTRRAVRGSIVGEIPAAALPAPESGEIVPPPGEVDPDRALSAAVVTAILIGDRAGIPPDVVDRLQRAGTFHVIAISGGNVAILTGLVLGVWRVLRVPSRAAAVATAVAIASYGIVAGGSASVARATLVALVYLTAKVLDVRADALAVMWTALLVLLAWAPLDLFDPGFLLTSGATLGILASTMVATPAAGTSPSARSPRDYGFHAAVAWLGAVARATVAADVMLLPVATTFFSRVTVAGLALNPAAIPLMTVAQICGLVIVAAGEAMPQVASAAGEIAHGAVHGLVRTALVVDYWRFLSWRVPPPSAGIVVVYYAAWATWVLARCRGWTRAARVLLAAALVGTASVAWLPTWLAQTPGLPLPATAHATARPCLSVVFFDVGQGDAALLRFPGGQAWLVDAGGIPGPSAFDVGARVVAPALWALGVRRLDVLAVTHGDPDHIGGGASMAEDFKPREVWEGVPVEGHAPTAHLRERAATAGSVWRQHLAGDRVDIGGVRVRVLHPSPPDWVRRKVRNDDSLTLMVEYEDVAFLLPGDIGAAVEATLALPRPAGRLIVLKVPHHGSAGSSSAAWLQALRPSLAVVSAGRGNRFGHPAPAALARYAALGVPVLRTDRSGAIAVVTDGRDVIASSWDGARWITQWQGRARPEPAGRGVTR